MSLRAIQPCLIGFITAFTLLTSGAHAAVVERLEASVNSDMVLLSDISQFKDTLVLRSQLDPLFAGTELASKGSSAPRNQVVQFLIEERLISQAFPVPDSEVESEINSIIANNRISRETLRNTLKEQGFSYEDYFELIRSSTTKRNLIDREIRTRVTITDDDLKNAFYGEVTKGREISRAYELKAIFVDPANYRTAAGAREVAERARAAVEAGEPFEEVSKRMSEGPGADHGGDLGVLSEDQMSPVIRDAVKKMKIGELSPVLGGTGGGPYLVVKLMGLKTGEDARFEKMKEQLRAKLMTSEYQKLVQLWIERQRQTAFIHVASQP